MRNDPAAIGTDVEVIGPAGNLVAQSRPRERRLAPSRSISDEVIQSRQSRFATVRLGGRELRVFVQRARAPTLARGSGGAVVVAASTDAIEDGLCTPAG